MVDVSIALLEGTLRFGAVWSSLGYPPHPKLEIFRKNYPQVSSFALILVRRWPPFSPCPLDFGFCFFDDWKKFQNIHYHIMFYVVVGFNPFWKICFHVKLGIRFPTKRHENSNKIFELLRFGALGSSLGYPKSRTGETEKFPRFRSAHLS